MRRRQLFQALGVALLSPAIEKLATVVPAAAPACFVRDAVFQTDMLVAGFGVHYFGEPIDFTPIIAERAESVLPKCTDWTAPTWEESWANAEKMARGAP